MARKPAEEQTPNENASENAVAATEKVTKSIVPSKYSGRYKGGGSDSLAEFIKTQSSGKDGFEFSAFFELCRKNGIAEEKVAHYEGLVAEKAHGAEGRARMTLRNMLAPIARKNGGLVGLDGETTELDLPKPAASGAAAKAQADAAANKPSEEPVEEVTVEDEATE